MKLAILFSGGKDSCMASFLAKKYDHDIACLVSLISKNKESYMFHTPSIKKTEAQAQAMGVSLLKQNTLGLKEEELKDLEKILKKAKKYFEIEGVVTGAIKSTYQASRIQKICDKLNLECFNPLWQVNEFEYLQDLIKNDFEVIITGVFAYPFDESWLGKKIDKDFIEKIKILNQKYQINPAGEGGELETFVLSCPLFNKKLELTDKKISGENNSFRMEIKVK
jgi:diphthine-ammonia ligase